MGAVRNWNFMGLALGVAALAGCESASPDPEDVALTKAPPAAPVVRACGSTTLGDRVLPALWEQFSATPSSGQSTVAGGRYAGVPVQLDVAATSSQEGLAALTAGDCDLAMFSGPWTDTDGVTATKVGRDAILVMTNPEAPSFTDVSIETLKQWYSGQGLPKGLSVLAQPQDHGTHAAFVDLLGLDTITFEKTAIAVPDGTTPWIWYESAQRLVDASGFTPVAIRGADKQPHAPALDTIASGAYPLVRDLHLLVREGDGGAATTLARALADYAASKPAAAVFESNYMLHPTRSAAAAPVSGRCDPPAVVDGARMGWVAFDANVSDTPRSNRGLQRTLRSAGKRAYDKGGELVVIAYGSESESCDVASARATFVNDALTAVVDELAKMAPWGTDVPLVRSVVSGSTRYWGVRPEDNQQVLVLLVPPQTEPSPSAN